MSFSTALLHNSEDKSTPGFSLRMNKTMKNVEYHNRDNIVAMKILMQGKTEQTESKTTKKLCMCSPTSHPGSFRCRYHRSPSFNKVNSNNMHVAAREYMKLKSMKPPLSRFSMDCSVASELSR